MYALLRDCCKQAVEWDRVICVQMDEYADVGSDDERSTASDLLRELVVPLGIGRFIKFYDTDGSPHCSLEQYETRIRDLGNLDCAIHGVGRNGHIGFNEPGAQPHCRTRVALLDASTQAANNVGFKRGVTLGLDTLGRARVSILVLRGIEKRSAAELVLYGPDQPSNPSAYLRRSGSVSVYLDPEATPAAWFEEQEIRLGNRAD